jgi:phenylacetate-coenzyme A ligase PaaK-like adenylate-forming protein
MSILRTAKFWGIVSMLRNVPHQNPARLERLRRRRLGRLVRFAVRRSSFFRDKYRGIDLNHFALTDLPPTTKEELMAHFEDAVTDPRIRRNEIEGFLEDPDNLGRWYLGRYALSHTSGSQGIPMLIVQERRTLEILFGILSSRSNPNGRPGVLEGIGRLVSPRRIAIVTMQRGFYPSGAAAEFMGELVGRFVRVRRLSSMQSDLIERLNEFQPEVIVAYASVLEALALQSQRLRLSRLRQIANMSEQLTARARSRIEQAFGVPLPDHYGIGECLILTHGCQADGGAHVNADWVILEVVDDQYRPVPPGQLGKKVLVTNLANRVQPFIRYEVNDRIALATAPCRCGSRLPRIDRVEGRSAELFWTHDGSQYRMVSGVLFHSVADSLREIREWQAVQRKRNQIIVQLELLSDATLTAESVQRQFRTPRRRRRGGASRSLAPSRSRDGQVPPDDQ